MATSPKDKAEAPKLFFNSVFTMENLDNIPDVPSHDNGKTLTNVNITPNIIKKKLEQIDPNKRPGPNK